MYLRSSRAGQRIVRVAGRHNPLNIAAAASEVFASGNDFAITAPLAGRRGASQGADVRLLPDPR